MYVRSILLSVRARSWAHRGLNNKMRIHTGNDRRRRGAPRGRGRPCGAHKASPRLIPLSLILPVLHATPCRGIPAGRKREASTRDPVREAASSLPPATPVPSSSCRHFVDPFARFVPGQARLARGRVPPPVRLSVPSSDRRPVHCTTAASVQRGRARKSFTGFQVSLDSRE